ncbi:MAG TPA: 4a-hydroxytetrahydrobiopterin dehydratase [Actinocrinis sp.]|jgi:4a-hydroxytetrahydrobiopterin dehydratase|uniref:4a-hydroxytetrahydrobiopterin dehydratase n=1 Tax=Actinocrinis sp. TaxID=1920516 RepID=UPI002D6C51EC|nr:4a-hydroxytetrahydrobiopterin dehydratase [Actinocrinis sp.]HZU56296.1 4a-hydroxytetrahydrobiopterin dehydratase [Actinocrinis sp.]
MADRAPLDDSTVEHLLGSLEGWTREGDAIRRVYQAEDFPGAIHLVNVVAVLAEQARHHPDIDIRWRTLTFTLSTHDAGDKVTMADIRLAEQINDAITTQPAAR